MPLYYKGLSKAFKQEGYKLPLCIHVRPFSLSPFYSSVFMGVHTFLCMNYLCTTGVPYAQEQQKMSVAPGLEPPCEFWEANLGPSTEPLLHPNTNTFTDTFPKFKQMTL